MAAVRGGESRVLVLHGVPGVGKTALLDYAIGAATGLRVLSASGVESEIELAYAALHQLCAPLLSRLKSLPPPQRAALETVFGMRAGTPPDRFLVGLSVLSLLAYASEDGPLLCVVDDAQWMDRASAQALSFVARRMLAESVGLLFGARVHDPALIGLPELEVTGLRDADAHALLDAVTHARFDQHIRDRIVAETRGNPLALIELPRGLSAAQIAGGLGLLSAGALPDRIEQSFLNRIRELSEPTRLLLLVAAAEPTGDATLVWRAADRLGITPASALAEGTGGLLTFDERVTFRHPLVRSAIYQAAGARDRRRAHLALAAVTDETTDPDRRAWHVAAAASGPDDEAAAELERSAGRAQARGGLAAAAAFLQRAVQLTTDTSHRSDRALAAAAAILQAGDVEAARRLAGIAERDAQDEFQRARTTLVRGRIAVASGQDDGTDLLLAAAQRLEPFDSGLARETYLAAWGAAAGESRRTISRVIVALPPPDRPPGALDLVLRGLALLGTDDRAAAIPLLHKAVAALADQPAGDVLKWGRVAAGVAPAVWDDRAMRALDDRAVGIVRTAGALADLPAHLVAQGVAAAWSGDFAAASAIVAEAGMVAADTGIPIAADQPGARLFLSALMGRSAEAEALIGERTAPEALAGERTASEAPAGERTAADRYWASAILYNGLSRFGEAARAAEDCLRTADLPVADWVLPELVEAAARIEDERAARRALDRLAEATEPCETDWALGVLARSRALLTGPETAEELYAEAVERLSRTGLRPELARAHLLYGEWLRRERQRTEARGHLRTAYDMFVAIGMEAFAERARRELLAAGEAIRKRRTEGPPTEDLTDQERQIALLVRDGFSNPEVGTRLFLSPRTVEWHLRKIFAKLGVSSRRQLRDAMAGGD